MEAPASHKGRITSRCICVGWSDNAGCGSDVTQKASSEINKVVSFHDLRAINLMIFLTRFFVKHGSFS